MHLKGIAKKINKIILLFVFILTTINLLAFEDSIGKFIDVKGDVSLERLKKHIRPKINDAVQVKDFIITGAFGRTKLTFVDNSLLTIGNNSKVEITDFLLDKHNRKSIILVKAGALHTKAAKLLELNSRFEVRTPTAVIGARGTEWFSATGDNEQTTVFSISDTITVFNPAYPNNPVEVKEGYFTIVEMGKLPKKPEGYCPSDLYILMKQYGAEEGLKDTKLKVDEEYCRGSK